MSTQRKTLIGLVGTGAAALLMSYVPQFEGTILRGYKDPIGIVTACTGHTATAVLGRPYTKQECDNLLQDDLIKHAEPVLLCTPSIRNKPYVLASAISFAFNVGTSAYCRSTMAQLFNAGRYVEGCAQLDRWVWAGTQKLPGLVKRRQVERAMCEGKLWIE